MNDFKNVVQREADQGDRMREELLKHRIHLGDVESPRVKTVGRGDEYLSSVCMLPSRQEKQTENDRPHSFNTSYLFFLGSGRFLEVLGEVLIAFPFPLLAKAGPPFGFAWFVVADCPRLVWPLPLLLGVGPQFGFAALTSLHCSSSDLSLPLSV